MCGIQSTERSRSMGLSSAAPAELNAIKRAPMGLRKAGLMQAETVLHESDNGFPKENALSADTLLGEQRVGKEIQMG